MPGVEEFSANPLVFVDVQFEKHIATSAVEKFPEWISQILTEKVAGQQRSRIRLDQLKVLPTGSLVKVCAMVQDMTSPEFYAIKYDAEDPFKPGCYRPKTGIFRDELPGSPDVGSFVPAERICLHCVEVPGETEWVRTKTNGSVNEFVRMESDVQQVAELSSEAKRQKTEASVGVSMSHRIPIPDRSSHSCFVKIYHQLEDVKLNEVVEIVGILGEEDNSTPVIHAFHLSQLSHINPLIGVTQVDRSEFPLVRDQLLKYISAATHNDQVVAEYLLCHLISSIYFRKDVIPLGKFSLNLTGVQPDQSDLSRQLFNCLSSLVTKAHFLPLSLSQLNCSEFVPTKNYDTDELHSGQLQLSPDTHLLLDETALSPGQLDQKGLKNLSALRTLVLWQKVDYDFQFHCCEFPTSLPVLIVSEGKSILNADYAIPISRGTDGNLVSGEAIDESQLDVFRCYITAAKSAEYSIDDSVQKVIEETFVTLRQADKSVSTDDLNNLLVLARLLAISHGQTQLTREMWTRAVVLENLRKSRLNGGRNSA